MGLLRVLVRAVAFAIGLPLLLGGGVGLGMAYAPESGAVGAARGVFIKLVAAFDGLAGLGVSGDELVHNLTAPIVHFAVPAVGLVLLLIALWPRRGSSDDAESAKEGEPDIAPKLKHSEKRRAEKQVKDLVKKGSVKEAAELYLVTDQLDKAVDMFVKAGDILRAAEVRHDQNRFDEAAELFMQAGRHENAATIYSEHEKWEEAAEAFVQSGRKSMAAEMFEKAGKFSNAAKCYEESDFQRHAAQCWVRCQNWGRAASCLEAVVMEEGGKTTGDPRKEAEMKKLVLQCGKLHEQAGDPEKAANVLERGGCFEQAAELNLKLERFGQAAELFQRCNQPLKAADALRRLGEDKAAAQLMGEYHRDRGDEVEAAEAFEQAGDHLAAGDIYRKLQDFAKAGECFELNHDSLQAAEMFRLSGEPARAAAAYESGQKFAEAAECWGEAGDKHKQAELLVRAECFFDAGAIFAKEGQEDNAIKVLQKIEAGHPDLSKASAILGRIFKNKGMYSLSIKKLLQSLGDADLDASNIPAYYELAIVYDANRQFREAVDLYEKILANDYHYADVEDRLDAGREKLKLQELKEGPTSQVGGSTGSSLTPTGNARYQITAELGRGGMGIVYKAQDTVLDRVVAYKVLPDTLKENPQALKNFLREAKSAAQLNHPNIVTVYDAGEQDGRYYIAMEYVDGTTLKEILKRRGPIAGGGVMHVVAQLCEALAFAHEKKIVHRDIKTANAMWTRDKKAKIMDFGLAKVMEEVRNHTTLVSGTPYYMSPEQTLGKNVDHRTDIYSLGVTIFELCTGRLPFMEGNIPYHHVHTPPPEVTTINPNVSELMAGIIRRCLNKDPEARYSKASEILAEMKAARARRS